MDNFYKSNDLQDLEPNARLGNMSFMEYVQKNQHVLLTSINTELNKLYYIDLESMDPKMREGLFAWVLQVNRPRILANYPIMMTMGMLKTSPFYRYIPIRQIKRGH